MTSTSSRSAPSRRSSPLRRRTADGGSLIDALRTRMDGAPTSGPVFRALLGGTATLVAELVDQLRARGAVLRLNAPVVAILPAPDTVGTPVGGWTGTPVGGRAGTPVGGRTGTPVGGRAGTPVHGRSGVAVVLADGSELRTDAAVITVPAPVAAPLIATASPTAAAELRSLQHVPGAFVTFAFRRDQMPDGAIPGDLSGVLVPRDAGTLTTAVSFGSNKWPQWDDGTHLILRVAAGHRHDDRPSSLDDDELVAALRAEMSAVLGVTAAPVAARVTRWSPGFAQYAVGHLELVERIRSALTRDLPAARVAGADLGGLGIPACIAQGRAAVQDLLDLSTHDRPGSRVRNRS